jgi:hypothetical protein
MRLTSIALTCFALWPIPATAADLAAIDRAIAKEPVYHSKSPRYGLLVFGPEAAHRVWVVHDGGNLWVDRNGNGDLTEPGEKVACKDEIGRKPGESGYRFEIGDLTVGGKVRKDASVTLFPLHLLSAAGDFASAQAALKTDPSALTATVSVKVDSKRFKGDGSARVSFQAGFYDSHGFLLFAERPANAPIVHFDGPLQATLFDRLPTLRIGRETRLVLVVGTPGHGAGTLSMLAYADVIPETAHPRVEIVYPTAGDAPPAQEHYELKQRC